MDIINEKLSSIASQPKKFDAFAVFVVGLVVVGVVVGGVVVVGIVAVIIVGHKHPT